MSDDRTTPTETPAPAPVAPETEPATTDRRAAASPAGAGDRSVAVLLGEAAAMVRFYSRLPVPRLGAFDDPTSPPPFGRALRMLPWASLVIGLPAAVVVAMLGATLLPSLVVAVFAIATLAVITGAFHEDGLADVADGFCGGATAERRLEIMKDSRIGAFGGVALAAQFLLRAGLVAAALDRFGAPAASVIVLAVAALARVMPLVLMAALPPARPDGLGRAAGRPDPTALSLAGAGAGAIALLGLPPIVGAAALLASIAIAGAAVLGLGLTARARIGGFTGDVVGAGTIVAEIAALTGLLA